MMPGTDPLLQLLQDPSRAEQIPADAIPALLAHLAALQSALAARLLSLPPATGQPEAPEDRLLTPTEAAALLNMTPRWLYRHHPALPFTRRLSRKALRFSETGLKKWLATKRA